MLNRNRPKPLQHHIDEYAFENMDKAARGEPFHPSMKDYCFMFCVFLFFKRKIDILEREIKGLKGSVEENA